MALWILYGTTRVSRYQKSKSKTNLDFFEKETSEWQWDQLGHMQMQHQAPQITIPASHHLVYYRVDAPLAAQPTASKH